MTRRSIAAAAVIIAWLAGLALLVRREYFRPQLEELAEAALRISPGAVYYAVMDGDRQVGFASSTLDTTSDGIALRDYFLNAPSPVDTMARRLSVTTVHLSRALRLEQFQITSTTPGRIAIRLGVVDGDSAVAVADSTVGGTATRHRVALQSAVLLPDLIPLAVALGEKPHVGKTYSFPVFDPAAAAPRVVSVTVRAESSFVVQDTAIFDSTTARWRGSQPDTLHGWQIASDGAGGFTGWVDEQGRILTTTQTTSGGALILRRLPFEVAFENWRLNTAPPTAPKDSLTPMQARGTRPPPT